MDVYRRRCSSCCSLLLLLLFGSRQKLKEFVPTPIRILDILSYSNTKYYIVNIEVMRVLERIWMFYCCCVKIVYGMMR